MKRLLLLFCIFLIFSCHPEIPDSPTLAVVQTSYVRSSGLYSAVCYGEIISTGNDSLWEVGICWNETGDPTILDSHKVCDMYNETVFIDRIYDLEPEREYYFCAYALNSVGISYGDPLLLSTEYLPEISVGFVEDVSLSTAKIHFTIEDSLHRDRTQYICWSLSPDRNESYRHYPMYDTPDTIDFLLSQLNPDSRYFAWVAIGYRDITIHSDPIEFKTSMPILSMDLPEMIPVQGDTFTRGDGSYDYPYRTFEIDDFLIGKYEVTQSLFEEIMGRNPSHYLGGNHPVEGISWYESTVFCNLLSKLAGLETVYDIGSTDVTADFTKNGYRLPTDCEWEYAARSGGRKDRQFSGTDSLVNLENYAWFNDNSPENRSHLVGTKQPNDLGIYDMSGNVFELCWDWNGYNYYETAPTNNPKGPDSGYQKLMRGGSWRFNYYYCTTRSRWICPEWNDWNEPSGLNAADAYGHIGFRLVRNGTNN